MADYLPTIGIETHVQLKSKTKLFAAVGNDAREAPPNTLISHICVGMPGALPVLNEGALKLAARAAFALGTKPQKFSHFDRKHYFYPDLPKGYQITQYQNPIIIGGKVEINIDGQNKTINITRAHLEEDAGKTIHPAGEDFSLVDLNRAGTPLLEIVSEPEINSAAEAKAYVRELYLLMKYADVSDADLYHGNMRFDVNISLSDEPGKLGKRAEIKNLNSFRSVEAAVEYEIKRQTEILKKGEQVTQETRGWDEAKQKTMAQRGKEEAEDYRYMPEPDVPPVELDDDFISKIQNSMPDMPNSWRLSLVDINLPPIQIESLLEAQAEDSNDYLLMLKLSAENPALGKALANWFINLEIPLRREGRHLRNMSTTERSDIYGQVHSLIDAGKLSSTNAKAILEDLLSADILPKEIEEYARVKGLIQVSDESEIDKIVSEVIAENPQAAQDVKDGEMKAIGFLVGQVMAKSKGQANPGIAQQIIKKQLGI